MQTIITTDNPNYPVEHILSSKQITLSSNFEDQNYFLQNQESYKRQRFIDRSITKFMKSRPKEERWRDLSGTVKKFIKLCAETPDKATELLFLWTDECKAPNIPKAFNVLNQLRVSAKIMFLSTEEMHGILNVLKDSVDEISRRIGEMPENLYVMFYAADWVSHPILRFLSIEERIKFVTSALRNGKACTWLISSILHMMFKHNETTRKIRNSYFWLIKDELELFKKVTFERIQVELNSDFYKLHKPVYMFLFWNDVGTQEQVAELRSWIDNHIVDDRNFIKFVSLFTGTVITGSGTYWRVVTGSLNEFIPEDYVQSRLNRIADKNNTLSPMAIRLISGIQTMNSIAGERTYKKFFPY